MLLFPGMRYSYYYSSWSPTLIGYLYLRQPPSFIKMKAPLVDLHTLYYLSGTEARLNGFGGPSMPSNP